jgi:hypothetical protein
MADQSQNDKSNNIPWKIIGQIFLFGIAIVFIFVFGWKIKSISIFGIGLEPPETLAPEQTITTNAIAGEWVGTAKSGDFEFDVKFSIGESCKIGSTCGAFDFPSISCSGTFSITEIDGNLFKFKASNRSSGCNLAPDIQDSLQLLSDGTLLFRSKGSGPGEIRSILIKQK